MDILDFFYSNGVVVGENVFRKDSNIGHSWNIDKQLTLIVEIQKILMGKKSAIIPRIESSIGKEIESFIVQAKKVIKMILLLEEKKNKRDFDYFIIEKGRKAILRANNTLDLLNDEEYLRIISRSMNNYEVCLGRVDEGNLKKEGLEIAIRTIKYISYNMVEHDCYNYVKRLKRRGYEGDINCIIDDFAYKSRLNKESIRYMQVLANYPIESIKVLLKLKYDKDRFNELEWMKEIDLAEKIDGIELL